MAKLKLENDLLPDALVIAISSHVNDYRLCWSLNRSLGIALCRRQMGIEGKGPEQQAFFPVFDHLEEDDGVHISLIGNHVPEGVLMPEQRQADYFLVVDGEDQPDRDYFMGRVRQAEFVLAAFTLNINASKGAYKLLQ